MKSLQKNYDEDSEIKDLFFKQMLNILKIHTICIMIYYFYQKKQKLINLKHLFVISMTKKLSCSDKNVKTSIKSWIGIKKVHKVIQFNQEAWLMVLMRRIKN